MTVTSALVLAASHSGSVPQFVAAFTVLFALTGVGNGPVYKMIPAIFHAKAATRIEAGANLERKAFAAMPQASDGPSATGRRSSRVRLSRWSS